MYFDNNWIPTSYTGICGAIHAIITVSIGLSVLGKLNPWRGVVTIVGTLGFMFMYVYSVAGFQDSYYQQNIFNDKIVNQWNESTRYGAMISCSISFVLCIIVLITFLCVAGNLYWATYWINNTKQRNDKQIELLSWTFLGTVLFPFILIIAALFSYLIGALIAVICKLLMSMGYYKIALFGGLLSSGFECFGSRY